MGDNKGCCTFFQLNICLATHKQTEKLQKWYQINSVASSCHYQLYIIGSSHILILIVQYRSRPSLTQGGITYFAQFALDLRGQVCSEAGHAAVSQ